MSGLEYLFEWVLERSWQASALAALILLVQWVLVRRLPALWRHALWLPLLGLLILPALPESRLSIFNCLASRRDAPVPEVRVESIGSTGAAAAAGSDSALPMPEDVESRPESVDWKRLFAMVWATSGSRDGAFLPAC